MPLPSCEQFDMARCPRCPLKNIFARYIVNNQMLEIKGGKTNPENFLPAIDPDNGLTMSDYDKYKVLTSEDESSYYTIDDSQCEGPEEVIDFGVFTKIGCGALLASKTE